MATEPSYRRFTVTDYHRMVEAGILTEDDHVELIDGEIVEMTPVDGRHVACVSRLTRLLVQQLGRHMDVNIQSPVRLGEHEEPEPDAAVVRARDYGSDLPGPSDILLLIEVSDTTLSYGRTRKLPLYAEAEVPEVWLVDLQGDAVERHTSPVGDTYRVTVRVGRGEEIASLVVPELMLSADDVLG